jgi:hypothetical protein
MDPDPRAHLHRDSRLVLIRHHIPKATTNKNAVSLWQLGLLVLKWVAITQLTNPAAIETSNIDLKNSIKIVKGHFFHKK